MNEEREKVFDWTIIEKIILGTEENDPLIDLVFDLDELEREIPVYL